MEEVVNTAKAEFLKKDKMVIILEKQYQIIEYKILYFSR